MLTNRVRGENIERAIFKTLTRREDWFSTGSPLDSKWV